MSPQRGVSRDVYRPVASLADEEETRTNVGAGKKDFAREIGRRVRTTITCGVRVVCGIGKPGGMRERERRWAMETSGTKWDQACAQKRPNQ